MEETNVATSVETFELATLANEHTVIATTNFALYLSLLSGYLIVAYLAGNNLKRSQVLLINTVFALAATYFAFSYMVNIAISTIYLLNLPRPDIFHTGAQFFLVFAFLLFLGMLTAIPFSIRFMREMSEQEK